MQNEMIAIILAQIILAVDELGVDFGSVIIKKVKSNNVPLLIWWINTSNSQPKYSTCLIKFNPANTAKKVMLESNLPTFRRTDNPPTKSKATKTISFPH